MNKITDKNYKVMRGKEIIDWLYTDGCDPKNCEKWIRRFNIRFNKFYKIAHFYDNVQWCLNTSPLDTVVKSLILLEIDKENLTEALIDLYTKTKDKKLPINPCLIINIKTDGIELASNLKPLVNEEFILKENVSYEFFETRKINALTGADIEKACVFSAYNYTKYFELKG